ncbi:MAG: tetratricopeptide repeat protein [Elusimicrobia bacterium]|nr:tetratricopeptide repeat protein [Elusimicrobiota bacterium]
MMTSNFGPWTLDSCAVGWKSTTRRGVDNYKKGDYQSALDSFEEAGKTDEKNPTILYNKGCAAYKLQDIGQSRQSFQEAAGLETRNDGNSRAEALYNLGNTYLSEGKTKEAIESYKQALLSNPKDADARHNLALALKQKEEKQQKQNEQQKNSGQKNENNSQEKSQDNKQSREQNQQESQSLLDAYEQEEARQAQRMKKRRAQEQTAEYDW